MYEFKCIDSILDVSKDSWNQVLLDEKSSAFDLSQHYPFLRHEFLACLEKHEVVCERTGWQPKHILMYQTKDDRLDVRVELVGIMPMYIKAHSYGEFVFDQSWADAYASYDLDYYPKLLTAIPFSPVEGPRIKFTNSQHECAVMPLLLSYIQNLMSDNNILSWHVLYAQPKLSDRLENFGVSRRLNVNFQWFNKNFNDYDEYVQTLSSRKRKGLRKERASVVDQEITLERVEGADITAMQWDSFYEFYKNTYLRRSGHIGYLNKPFFKAIGHEIPENLLLVLAKNKQGDYIAGALNFKDTDNLYGRYWGCSEAYSHLHFECCYYQGIEYCIENKLKKFDPGVQGEHKIQRGFEPIYTFSNHYLAETVLSEPIKRFLKEELSYLETYKEEMEALLPFKKTS